MPLTNVQKNQVVIADLANIECWSKHMQLLVSGSSPGSYTSLSYDMP